MMRKYGGRRVHGRGQPEPSEIRRTICRRSVALVFAEHEIVALVHAVPQVGLSAGVLGCVVGSYGNGGYEVEFTGPDGRTLAVVTLGESDLRTQDR